VSDCYLDDDGMLSADFTVVEGTEETECTPQSLWVGVRPVFYGSEPSDVPMIQVCYQEAHMGGALAGPVWITPEVWRELNAAVEWRLKEREKMFRRRKTKKYCPGCKKNRRWFPRMICRRCYRQGEKKRDWLEGKRKRVSR
jgi:hypothetical protein